jgi:hypothetical protein
LAFTKNVLSKDIALITAINPKGIDSIKSTNFHPLEKDENILLFNKLI